VSDVRLAIVGSTSFAQGELALAYAKAIIATTITRYQPEVIISGGADGIDTLARRVAEWNGYRVAGGTFIEHLPKHQRWRPDGFEARNLLIARDCTHLLAIRCHASRTYGSGWTADQAEQLGRTVWRVLL
jgi:predicted Rossmann fold nucleotide-binding protein DprA/Smf involved in DNA uptake